MKKGGCQWEVAFWRGGTREQPRKGPRHAGRGGISISRHVADLQVKILSKETFKVGVAILRSLMRDRYSTASRAEQRQVWIPSCHLLEYNRTNIHLRLNVFCR